MGGKGDLVFCGGVRGRKRENEIEKILPIESNVDRNLISLSISLFTFQILNFRL